MFAGDRFSEGFLVYGFRPWRGPLFLFEVYREGMEGNAEALFLAADFVRRAGLQISAESSIAVFEYF